MVSNGEPVAAFLANLGRTQRVSDSLFNQNIEALRHSLKVLSPGQ